MASQETSSSVLLAIRAPLAMPAEDYRAYEEQWGDGTLLDWIFTRLRASIPHNTHMVCICDSPTEYGRLIGSCHRFHAVDILHMGSRGERHLCRLLMQRFGVRRVVIAGFSHAIAPYSLLHNVVSIHASMTAELSDVTHATFCEPLFAIDSALVEEMDRSRLPRIPQGIVSAAKLLLAARARDESMVRDFLWIRINAARRLGLSAKQWPEHIALRHRRDVAVLRHAWLNRSKVDGANGLVNAWKQAEISKRSSGAVSRAVIRRTGSRVRVLYAAHLPGFTGAHQSICQLIGALDRQRYEPTVLVSYEGTFSHELRRRNVPVLCADRNIATPGIESFLYAHKVIVDQKPDILHAQHLVGMEVICAAVAHDVRVVQHVRVQDITGLRHQLHAADAVIAVSAYIRERVLELDIDPTKIEVVFNGVDQSEFKPDSAERMVCRSRLKIPDHEFLVAIIARMAREKRHDLVIRAVAHVRQQLGRGHLIIVGGRDVDPAYQHEIQALVDREGLSTHVSTIEFVPDIRCILHACDVLALPSENEPLSRAVLDAMAVGVPPIVSDSGGSREIVQHGTTGFVVPAGDVRQVTDALLVLACDERLRGGMGAAAVHEIRRSLTAAHCAASTAAVYERVLRGDYQSSTRTVGTYKGPSEV